jgi:hypothetical protein
MLMSWWCYATHEGHWKTSMVYTGFKQSVGSPLANRFANGLEVCIDETVGLPTGWPTGWPTNCIVYTIIWLLDQRLDEGLDESNTSDASSPSPNSCIICTYIQPVVQPVGWSMQLSWVRLTNQRGDSTDVRLAPSTACSAVCYLIKRVVRMPMELQCAEVIKYACNERH